MSLSEKTMVRLVVDDEDLIETINVFCYEILKLEEYDVEEWVRNHIADMDMSSFRKKMKIEKDVCYQIVMTVQIEVRYCGMYNEECDEDLNILDYKLETFKKQISEEQDQNFY